MATRRMAYGPSAPITITLNSLGVGLARESTAIDNEAQLLLDAQVSITVVLAAGSPASDKAVYVYAYGSENGTNFSDNATGTDAALTMRSPSNLILIGTLATPDATGLTYRLPPTSIRAAFGGYLPRKWGIVVENRSGLLFGPSGCSASYTAVTETIA
jgi:hypothetical protein